VSSDPLVIQAGFGPTIAVCLARRHHVVPRDQCLLVPGYPMVFEPVHPQVLLRYGVGVGTSGWRGPTGLPAPVYGRFGPEIAVVDPGSAAALVGLWLGDVAAAQTSGKERRFAAGHL